MQYIQNKLLIYTDLWLLWFLSNPPTKHFCFSCPAPVIWWIVNLTPIPWQSHRNLMTHRIPEKRSASNSYHGGRCSNAFPSYELEYEATQGPCKSRTVFQWSSEVKWPIDGCRLCSDVASNVVTRWSFSVAVWPIEHVQERICVLVLSFLNGPNW